MRARSSGWTKSEMYVEKSFVVSRPIMAFIALVPEHLAGDQIPRPEADAARVERQPQLALALFQRELARAVRGDLERDQAAAGTIAVANRRDVAFVEREPAVGPGGDAVVVLGLPGREDAIDGRARQRVIVGMDEGEDRRADHLLHLEARLEPVHVPDAHVGVEARHERGHRGQHRLEKGRRMGAADLVALTEPRPQLRILPPQPSRSPSPVIRPAA